MALYVGYIHYLLKKIVNRPFDTDEFRIQYEIVQIPNRPLRKTNGSLLNEIPKTIFFIINNFCNLFLNFKLNILTNNYY